MMQRLGKLRRRRNGGATVKGEAAQMAGGHHQDEIRDMIKRE
jgi:hypothetical protein